MTRGDLALRLAVIAAIGVLYVWAYRVSAPSTGSDVVTSDIGFLETRRLAHDVTQLLRERGFDRALQPAERLAAAFPNNHIYAEQLATIYHELNRPADEAKQWDSFMETSPTPIDGCPRAGLAHERAGDQDAARRVFERCRDLDADDDDSVFYLARAYERSGQMDRAAALYTEGAAKAPDYVDMQVGAARVAMFQGRTADARKAVDQVLARAPDNVDALLVAGLAWQRDGNRAQARTMFERVVALAPEYVDAYLALGAIAEDDGRTDDAARAYERANTIDPSRPEARERLGRLRGGSR